VGTTTAVRDLVRSGNYDIVHTHTPIASFVTRYALRRHDAASRPVVIYTAHGFHFFEGGPGVTNRVYSTTERAAARWTDYLVTVNREDYDAARAFGTIDPARVRYIPGIGVDTDRYSPEAASKAQRERLRVDLDIAPENFMLAMVAEFSPVKRHTHLFQALALLKQQRVTVVLVGDGPDEPKLRDAVESLGIADRVRWAGYRRDIPALLAAGDGLVICSQREGLNRSVLEAMATGLPVIGTRTRGIADAITEKTGWLVPKDDPSALALAIEAAASDPLEARRRGDAGRERAVAEYALPLIIDAYEELYREALASRL
jgi:glycosyltransferase involved in cell wall biosynthesis